jgi:hypothetical protein
MHLIDFAIYFALKSVQRFFASPSFIIGLNIC